MLWCTTDDVRTIETENEKLLDLNLREVATFVPLIILAVWIGIYPKPFLDRLEKPIATVIARVAPQHCKDATALADCEKNKPTSPSPSPLW